MHAAGATAFVGVKRNNCFAGHVNLAQANGAALKGLLDLAAQAGAEVVGAGIAVEKAFQPGGAQLRAKGLRVESLARIKRMGPGFIEFC